MDDALSLYRSHKNANKQYSEINSAFDIVSDEALEQLRKRGENIITTETWDELEQEAHDDAFTVANIMSADVVQEVYDYVERAVSEGLSFDRFRFLVESGELTDRMKKAGWTGDSRSRLKIIYDTNISLAQAKGKYQRLMLNADNKPYGIYHQLDRKTKNKDHEKWNGKKFRLDDPIWDTIFPPSAFNCFPAGTLIDTPNGMIPIEKINKGDLVFSGAGNVQPVTTLFTRKYSGELITIDVKGIGKLSSTPDHRFLTLRGWIEARNLKISDKLIKVVPNSFVDVPIRKVNNFNTVSGNIGMTLPIKRGSTVTEALDTNSQFWNKNVNPVRCYKVIMDRIKSKLLDMFNDNLFATSRLSNTIRVNFLSGLNQILVSFGILFSYIWSCSRFNNFHLFRKLLESWCVKFIFPGIWMSTAIIVKFQHSLSRFFGYNFPAFSISFPLNGDQFLRSSLADTELSKYSWHNSIAPDAISFHKFVKNEILSPVQVREGFVSGAPLDFFDSLNEFVSFTLHNKIPLLEINNITTANISNNIDIYNLEIKKDNSYSVSGVCVHNCACWVQATDDPTGVENGADYIDGINTEEYQLSPIKPWKPDTSKYVDGIQNELNKMLKVKENS